MIPYGRQDLNEDDIQAVVDVLRSDYLTQGPQVELFEASLCKYSNAKYATAVNSATSALHLSCLALELGENDILWTSAITFVASANCAFYCGATVDLIDIDPRTVNIDVDYLERKLEKAERENRLPKVVVAVHFAGQSCDMQKIKFLADKYGFSIIEDASHAIGGSYRNDPVGCCRYSDITVFSFHPVKIITAGEGGAALTNDVELAERIRLLRSHGVTRDTEKLHKLDEGPWYYEQLALGMNYRITDVQAALGTSQLTRIDEFVKRRNEIAAFYNQAFSELPLCCPQVLGGNHSAWHLYTVTLQLGDIKVGRKAVFTALRERGLNVNVHYIPLYKQPYFIERLDLNPSEFPEAEHYYHAALTLPLYPSMTEETVLTVSDTVTSVLESVAC